MKSLGWGPDPKELVSLIRKHQTASALYPWWTGPRRGTQGHSEKAAVYKPGREARQKLNFLAPWSWTSGLQYCEQINSCCWGHSEFCGILLQWPWFPREYSPPSKTTFQIPLSRPSNSSLCCLSPSEACLQLAPCYINPQRWLLTS